MKNKNAGAYCIKAELPKFWTQELVKEIEVILNEIELPKGITQGK